MLGDSTGHRVLNFVVIEQELSEKIKSVRMRAPVRRRGGIVLPLMYLETL
jgi:hypothetical protein